MADYVTMTLPSWITEHKRWEKPTIGGIQLPGIVKLSNTSIKLRVEANKGSGNDGGGSLIRGLEIPKFSFELTLLSREDEDTWNKIVPTLLPRKDPTQRGTFAVYHPSLARFRIVACIVEELEEVPPTAGGPLVARIHCIAVLPVKKNATKKIGSKSAEKAAQSPPAISIGGTGNAGPQRFPGVTPPSQKVPIK